MIEIMCAESQKYTSALISTPISLLTAVTLWILVYLLLFIAFFYDHESWHLILVYGLYLDYYLAWKLVFRYCLNQHLVEAPPFIFLNLIG